MRVVQLDSLCPTAAKDLVALLRSRNGSTLFNNIQGWKTNSRADSPSLCSAAKSVPNSELARVNCRICHGCDWRCGGSTPHTIFLQTPWRTCSMETSTISLIVHQHTLDYEQFFHSAILEYTVTLDHSGINLFLGTCSSCENVSTEEARPRSAQRSTRGPTQAGLNRPSPPLQTRRVAQRKHPLSTRSAPYF